MAASLRDLALLAHLADEEIAALVAVGEEETRPAGAVVCAEGSPADSLYVILDGRVRVERCGADGAVVELATLGPGESFGEPALFDGGPRSATVTALEPSRFFVLDRARFLDFLFEHPRALSAVMAGVGGQIRAAHQKSFWDLLEAQTVRAEMEEARYRSLAELVAGVAHEVNTPLGVVNTAASILTDRLAAVDDAAVPASVSAVWEDVKEAASLIQANLRRTNRLVESFKNLSARQAVVRVEEVDLNAVVCDVIGVFARRGRPDRLDVELRDERADPARPWVGDAGTLSQILLNLLTNVQRYAYPGGAGGRVKVVLADCESGSQPGFVLTVRDFGAGIPRDAQERVFEPFFTTGRARGGTGLGLAIVHNLATAGLGGAVSLHSEPGRGTEVRVTLPQAAAASEDTG